MANMSIVLNERAVTWDDEGKYRKNLKCEACGCDTKGRAYMESPTHSFANKPLCMNCAMAVGFAR